MPDVRTFHIAKSGLHVALSTVPERDENEEAVRNVEKATESDPVKGEDLLESEELKRKLREAREKEQSRPSR